MRHVTNTYDFRKPDARYNHVFLVDVDQNVEWKNYIEWCNKHIIGLPKATSKYTVVELEIMGMIGLYLPN
jgi:hypothetical protein